MDSRGNESDYHISGHALNSCFNNIYFGAFYAIATAIIVLAVSALLAIYTLKIRKPRVAKTNSLFFFYLGNRKTPVLIIAAGTIIR